MVALVSFTPCAGGGRGLTIATDLSQEAGPLVRVTGRVWVADTLRSWTLINATFEIVSQVGLGRPQ